MHVLHARLAMYMCVYVEFKIKLNLVNHRREKNFSYILESDFLFLLILKKQKIKQML